MKQIASSLYYTYLSSLQNLNEYMHTYINKFKHLFKLMTRRAFWISIYVNKLVLNTIIIHTFSDALFFSITCPTWFLKVRLQLSEWLFHKQILVIILVYLVRIRTNMLGWIAISSRENDCLKKTDIFICIPLIHIHNVKSVAKYYYWLYHLNKQINKDYETEGIVLSERVPWTTTKL